MQADVHFLATYQETGSGGREYTLTLLGKNKFENKNDTLHYTTKQSATSDDRRAEMVRVLKLGLTPYLMKTPLAEKLSISYSGEAKQKIVVDDWDYWVFDFNANGSFSGEKQRKNLYSYGSFSANRVTEQWKINLGFESNYNEQRYKPDSVEYLSTSRGQGFYGLVVQSIDEHWSSGIAASVSTSTYNNTQYSINGAPAIEYDVFPYSESTRNQLLILYKISFGRIRYNEETLYGKIREWLFYHSLSAALIVKQSWGNANASFEALQYLHNKDFNHLRLSSHLSFRIFEGFSFRLGGSVSAIHDQLSLPKGGASEQDILLYRKQLATNFRYSTSFGFSYSFGSIYNNIVNPRFGEFNY
jgi:hypothetical protein